jgi:very-short-patch-repair endonuclease
MATGLPDGCTQLLALQHGVIARWQAPAVGLSPATIDALLRRDRWRPLYRGVYAAYTGAPARECVLWAGVLRAGPGAVLSHHTAAELDGLTDCPAEAIHVTVGAGRRVRISGEQRHQLAPRILVHRSDRVDIARHPARTPPRTRIEETVLDLAAVSASFDDAFSWLSRGCGRRLVTPHMLRETLIMRSRTRWHDEIVGALAVIADGVHSNLEYRYVRDVERAHGLPKAKRQARMPRGAAPRRWQYLDNLYELFGVAVELDGAAHHPAEDRWRDIRKDNVSAALGIVTLRFSWADVTRRGCAVAAGVAAALQQRGWEGQPSRCGAACALMIE